MADRFEGDYSVLETVWGPQFSYFGFRAVVIKFQRADDTGHQEKDSGGYNVYAKVSAQPWCHTMNCPNQELTTH